jgi:hypothetical protein
MIMELLARVASALVFLAFFMKTMMPLRLVAIASNVAFVVYALFGLHYGIFEKVLPILVLHMALLPLNILRLNQMQRLIGKIREASANDSLMEPLIPYMSKESFAQGEALFHKGDSAEKVYYIRAGSVTVPEIDKELTEGSAFGEVGVFAPQKKEIGKRDMFEALCHMQHPQGQRAAALLSGSKVRPSYRSFAFSLCRGKRGHDP